MYRHIFFIGHHFQRGKIGSEVKVIRFVVEGGIFAILCVEILQCPGLCYTKKIDLLQALHCPPANYNMAGDERKSLSATLRLTSDIWFREKGRIELFPSSALRIVDHHLHASGIIPRLSPEEDNGAIVSPLSTPTNGNRRSSSRKRHPRLYEHDWMCLSQSVSCLPMSQQHVVLCLESEWSTFSHLWVDSVGNACISIGNLITLDSHVLATCRRVFVRRDVVTGKPLKFTQQERYRLQKECSMDETISEILSMDPTGGMYALPALENFGTFLPKATPNPKEPCLKVMIGPQHVNAMTKHGDGNFLLEIAIQAMIISKLPIETPLSIQYLGEARLGNELECYIHDDRVFIVRTIPKSGKPVLVAVAK